MTTKRDIILAALNEVGIAAYQFDIQPDQIMAALGQLDRMVASWASQGAVVAYSSTNSDPDDVLTALESAHEAMILNLAIRLGPSYGRGASPETKAMAKQALDTVRASYMASNAPQVQLDNMAIPAGAGNYRPVYLTAADMTASDAILGG
jgi:hypothetical protein